MFVFHFQTKNVFILFQLHLTATGFEFCDETESPNATQNSSSSNQRQTSSYNSSMVFDGNESTICANDFATSFPDVTNHFDVSFHFIQNLIDILDQNSWAVKYFFDTYVLAYEWVAYFYIFKRICLLQILRYLLMCKMTFLCFLKLIIQLSFY